MNIHIRFPVLVGFVMLTGSAMTHGQSIYSCTDARGHKFTSDRPIAECMDRDQAELSSTGTVKRIIKPSMTAEEREAYEEKIRLELAEQNRRSEERRKNRALVARYPNATAHEKERKETLTGLEAATTSAQARLTELQARRKKLEDELEFYRSDISKAPGGLRRQINDNHASAEAQMRFLDSQALEAKRINARFDEELVKLKELWPLQPAVTSHTGKVAPKK